MAPQRVEDPQQVQIEVINLAHNRYLRPGLAEYSTERNTPRNEASTQRDITEGLSTVCFPDQ